MPQVLSGLPAGGKLLYSTGRLSVKQQIFTYTLLLLQEVERERRSQGNKIRALLKQYYASPLDVICGYHFSSFS